MTQDLLSDPAVRIFLLLIIYLQAKHLSQALQDNIVAIMTVKISYFPS